VDNKRIPIRCVKMSKVVPQQFWLRVNAFLTDFLFLHLVFIPVIVIGYSIAINGDFIPYQLIVSSFFPFAYYLSFGGVYFVFLESSLLKGTFGKVLFRLKVVDNKGNRISLFRAFVRYFVRIISIITVYGVFVIDTNKKRMSLHDFICRSVVIRKNFPWHN
jgi:uncharacterized RDD family membrane protein YckC